MTTTQLIGVAIVLQTMTIVAIGFIAAMVSKALDHIEAQAGEEGTR